jgi:hypothetical protein
VGDREAAQPDIRTGGKGTMGTIILYHGTYHDFDKIDVSAGKPFKDFGQGFYTSQNYEHAVGMATRNAQIERRRLKRMKIDREPTPLIYTYELDEDLLPPLKVKRFEIAGKAWVRFIVRNRTNETPQHDYDIVIGPTANDKTLATAQAYLAGDYGTIDSDEAVELFLKRIEPYSLPLQFFFGTGRAAGLLRFMGRSVVK